MHLKFHCINYAEQYFLHEPLDDRYAPHKADVQQVNFFIEINYRLGAISG